MTDKVALVTGASRGIGKACARALSQAGYRVAVHYRSGHDEAVALCNELKNAMPFKADLSVEAEVTEMVKAVKNEMGRIDVLVNNAGMSIDQVIAFAKPEDFQKLLQVNLFSAFMTTKLVSKIMIKQKEGRIINMGSVVGHTGNAGQSMYAATKGAITAFTQSIAQDLAPFNILCNSIAPGFIETEMTGALSPEVREGILTKVPLKRLGRSEEIANVVTFLASDQSSYITGSTIHVNGGMYTN